MVAKGQKIGLGGDLGNQAEDFAALLGLGDGGTRDIGGLGDLTVDSAR